ncbi:MAG: type transport system permease protein [Chloroflexota bacterium]|jgi:ABC-2 type transport system permease protein|nr:type transport system permease protein [Chloroflexota bacterium]
MSPFKMLTRILAIVGKELISVVRRPGALVSLVFGPFLIMAIFGLGYSGYRRPLDTIVVVPPQTGLPTDKDTYAKVGGEGLRIVDVVPDDAVAMDRLARQEVDVVLVAPADIQQRFKAGQRTPIDVRVNAIDPVQQSYAIFLARGLEAAINRAIVEQAVQQGESYAISKGAGDVAKIPPDVVAAPAEATVDNIAQSTPTVVQFFGPAVLALILQHMSVTLIALSLVRERRSGVFELFRISPITTAELVTGKLIAFGLFSGAIALLTVALLVIGFGVPMLGDPGWVALVVLLLIMASLGLGLLIAAVSDSEPQAVQLSLLLLLASVFFSGFVLAINEFSEPVRSLIYALPVSNGIRLIDDFLFRGGTVVVWQIWLLAGLGVAYIAGAWVLLRRVMSRA